MTRVAFQQVDVFTAPSAAPAPSAGRTRAGSAGRGAGAPGRAMMARLSP
jgi:hypothetical protein